MPVPSPNPRTHPPNPPPSRTPQRPNAPGSEAALHAVKPGGSTLVPVKKWSNLALASGLIAGGDANGVLCHRQQVVQLAAAPPTPHLLPHLLHLCVCGGGGGCQRTPREQVNAHARMLARASVQAQVQLKAQARMHQVRERKHEGVKTHLLHNPSTSGQSRHTKHACTRCANASTSGRGRTHARASVHANVRPPRAQADAHARTQAPAYRWNSSFKGGHGTAHSKRTHGTAHSKVDDTGLESGLISGQKWWGESGRKEWSNLRFFQAPVDDVVDNGIAAHLWRLPFHLSGQILVKMWSKGDNQRSKV